MEAPSPTIPLLLLRHLSRFVLSILPATLLKGRTEAANFLVVFSDSRMRVALGAQMNVDEVP